MSKDKVLSLLKDGQLEAAVALIKLSESLTSRSEFNETILTFLQDSEFLLTALDSDFVELFDYGIAQGFIDIQMINDMVCDRAKECSAYTKSLMNALMHPRRPRLIFVNRLGPPLIVAYILMHLSMVHRWLLLHLLAICFFILSSVQTWFKSGYYTCSNTNSYGTSFSTKRCKLCCLPMRTSHQWHRKQVHCRYCNICVNCFDHHCFWLGCCINEDNYGWFMISLTNAICIYLLGLLDSAVYFYKRSKIPIQIRIGITIQLLCYAGFFTTLLMHINRKRYVTKNLVDRFRK